MFVIKNNLVRYELKNVNSLTFSVCLVNKIPSFIGSKA